MTIKELRKEKGLTQARLGELLGVSQKAVAACEAGRMKVSAKMANGIREVYGVEVEAGEVKAAKRPVKKISAPPLEMYIQSPYGGNITPEEVAAMMPVGTVACYVRVDQNLIWWVRGDGETGAVEIWPDNRA